MASWVITMSKDYPQHWDIAKRHGFWDMTSRRDVILGDLVYFWLAQGSLLGQARATSDAEPITDVSVSPWDDSGERDYTWRFSFEVLDDQPRSQPAWNEIAARLSKPYPLLSPPRLTDPADETVLASYFSETTLEIYSLTDAQREAEIEAMGFDVRRFEYRAIAMRQGRGRFRTALVAAYGACAVTGTTAMSVLEAAHISPFKGDPTHKVWNGLLLRADVHTLFDLFRITVTPDLVVHVAPELAGTDYGGYDGQPLRRVPEATRQRPDADLLAKHNGRCSWL